MKTNDTISRHDAHMSINYGRYPVVMAAGAGCRVTDADGKHYLDLFAGFGAPVLGHCHPELVTAVTEQAQSPLARGQPLSHRPPDPRGRMDRQTGLRRPLVLLPQRGRRERGGDEAGPAVRQSEPRRRVG